MRGLSNSIIKRKSTTTEHFKNVPLLYNNNEENKSSQTEIELTKALSKYVPSLVLNYWSEQNSNKNKLI